MISFSKFRWQWPVDYAASFLFPIGSWLYFYNNTRNSPVRDPKIEVIGRLNEDEEFGGSHEANQGLRVLSQERRRLNYPGIGLSDKLNCKPEHPRMLTGQMSSYLGNLHTDYFAQAGTLLQLRDWMSASLEEFYVVVDEQARQRGIREVVAENYKARMTDAYVLSVSDPIRVAGGEDQLSAFHTNVLGWVQLPVDASTAATYSYACAIFDNTPNHTLYQRMLSARARACTAAICETLLQFNEASAAASVDE